MSYHCQRCDDEITYTLDHGDFEHGLLCEGCRVRHDKFDDYRVWRELKYRRESYIENMAREFIEKQVDELWEKHSEEK